LEIASVIPTIADQRLRLLTDYDFPSGLQANNELAKRSNPALSKPGTRQSPQKLCN
jgi:hypothetical protein